MKPVGVTGGEGAANVEQRKTATKANINIECSILRGAALERRSWLVRVMFAQVLRVSRATKAHQSMSVPLSLSSPNFQAIRNRSRISSKLETHHFDNRGNVIRAWQSMEDAPAAVQEEGEKKEQEVVVDINLEPDLLQARINLPHVLQMLTRP